ncbi:hypothetical protein J4Q44_G00065780 [Coregonus suidteri]|uniref:Serum response factor-binding protein 1 n=1 Tax=Coregonus suidteri TaxID=861788 RepID=A0AAN8M719_9TELE
MKTLKPDPVTKAALQKNLSFEFVCRNPKATISDRAITRIATHPQFSKKIDTIKAAIKAFKDERMTVEKGDKGTVKKQPLKVVEVIEQSKDSDGGGVEEGEEEEGGKGGVVVNEEEMDEEEDGTPAESQSLMVDEPAVIEKQPVDKTVRVKEEETSPIENKESPIESTVSDPPPKEMTEADKTLIDSSTPFTIEAPQIVPTQNIVTQNIATMKNTPQKQVTQKLTKDTPATQKTHDPKPQRDCKAQNKDVKNKEGDKEGEEEDDDDEEEEESGLESSDDEEEYFDDSTEERFRKQSSQSEESDNDDFFLGKVTKFKKKKSDAATVPPGGGEGKSSALGKTHCWNHWRA